MLSRYIHLNPIRVKSMRRMPCKEKIQYLQKYKWSSLPGYINKRKKQKYIDYDLVLEEYGGNNDEGRRAYGNIISIDISGRLDMKEKIVGQSIIGKDDFIEKVLDKYLKMESDQREQPSLPELQGMRAKEEIILAVKEETGKGLKEIIKAKGIERAILMDLLYRAGGLRGTEIGNILGVDYSTVSQKRKMLRDRLRIDRKLKQLFNRIEVKLSR
jgi:hypothetical protein